jgi:hypothetical protein
LELALAEYEKSLSVCSSIPLLEQDDGAVKQKDQQRQREVAVEAMREDDNEDEGSRKREQQGEKLQYLGEIEQKSNDVHHSESSDHSHDTSSFDEDLWPVKRRRPRLGRPRSLTPPLATQVEINDAQSQADHGYPQAPINNEHHPSRTSRSSSAATESVPVAEYQEWPFQGFPKQTGITNAIAYNPEFNLTRIPEHLNLVLKCKCGSLLLY